MRNLQWFPWFPITLSFQTLLTDTFQAFAAEFVEKSAIKIWLVWHQYWSMTICGSAFVACDVHRFIFDHSWSANHGTNARSTLGGYQCHDVHWRFYPPWKLAVRTWKFIVTVGRLPSFRARPISSGAMALLHGGSLWIFLNMPWSSKIEACDFEYEVAGRAPWSFT